MYRKACHLLAELKHKAYEEMKFFNFDLNIARENRCFQMNELDEWDIFEYESSKLYKEQAKIYHDRHIKQDKQFKERDQVLIFVSRLKLYPSMLKSRWSGPF